MQARAAIEGSTFTIVGTYGYTPMEQFGGRAVPASDLYALGTTLIHLLTGTAPANSPQQDLRIHFRDRVSASPNLVGWLEDLTEPSLERRFSSAHQALAALKSGRSTSVPIRIRQPVGSRVQLISECPANRTNKHLSARKQLREGDGNNPNWREAVLFWCRAGCSRVCLVGSRDQKLVELR